MTKNDENEQRVATIRKNRTLSRKKEVYIYSHNTTLDARNQPELRISNANDETSMRPKRKIEETQERYARYMLGNGEERKKERKRVSLDIIIIRMTKREG